MKLYCSWSFWRVVLSKALRASIERCEESVAFLEGLLCRAPALEVWKRKCARNRLHSLSLRAGAGRVQPAMSGAGNIYTAHLPALQLSYPISDANEGGEPHSACEGDSFMSSTASLCIHSESGDQPQLRFELRRRRAGALKCARRVEPAVSGARERGCLKAKQERNGLKTTRLSGDAE